MTWVQRQVFEQLTTGYAMYIEGYEYDSPWSCAQSYTLRWTPNSIMMHSDMIFNNSSVQSLSHVQLFAIPWTAAHQASLSITNSQSLLKLMFIKSVMQPSHPLLSSSPPAFNFSQNQGLFKKRVSSLHQVAKVLELQQQSFQ